MSLFKGHVIGGTVSFIIYLTILILIFSYEFQIDVLFWFLFCLIGALCPDIDTNSLSQKIFYGTLIIIDVYFISTGSIGKAAVLGFFALLPILAKHRGWTHSFSAALIIPSPLAIIPFLNKDMEFSGMDFYIPTVIGYISHLVLDREFKIV